MAVAAAGARLLSKTHHLLLTSRSKTTAAQHIAARHRDPTFEKLMEGYKHYLKVVAVQDLILSSPSLSLPLPHFSSLSQRLHLNRGAAHFVRSFPRVFSLSYDPASSQPLLRLTPAASLLSSQESTAASSAAAVDALSRLLSISPSRSLPLRAVFKVWKELGLPDDFEDSVLDRNPNLFTLKSNPRERNTHILHLSNPNPNPNFTAAVEEWRIQESGKSVDETEFRFGFKQEFPPGMRLTKNFRSKLKEWQRLPYLGPYDDFTGNGGSKRSEKRAVGIVHEFLSLTVEKMVEVEKISQFRRWFGIDLNIRDLFLDHPGMFYLSTKGKRHTVFLREAYRKGRLIEPNPVYDARRRLLELVLMRRRGWGVEGKKSEEVGDDEEEGHSSCEEMEDDDDDEEGGLSC